MTRIEIREHRPGKDVKDFLRAADVVFADDPQYIPPLSLLLHDQLSPKSPFFQHAEVGLFTAWRDGELVGRISAQVDRKHLERYGDALGFFGFFDTVDDPDVAQALLGAASQWLKQRGMKRMRGPLNLSINQEVGLLVEGFDTPPMVMMPHGRPYQDEIYRKVGLEKVKDLLAWRWDIVPGMNRRCMKALSDMKEAGVVLRQADMKHEVPALVQIQDDAWHDNWGHVSMSEAEAKQLKKELSLIIDPSIAIVAEIDGELAGMAIAIPNLNEATRDFGGGLGPVRLAKLLWRLKVEHPRSARVALVGVRKKYRQQKQWAPLALALVAEINRCGYQSGYEWAELSWTLEDNGPVTALIKMVGGYAYKRYRLYEKDL
jgi:hypothetical protein